MSMYTAVSALKAQQTKLDVVGNNLANVNTVGYKGQTVSFSDLLSQTISSATAANGAANKGGTNAQQVGLGVGLAAVTTNMETGSTQATGVTTDLSIGGSGFFIVEGETSGTYLYTRAGNFGVDASGNLNVNGYKVCGWEDYTTNADGTISYDTQQAVSGLNLFTGEDGSNKKVIAPQQTTEVALTGDLNSSATAYGTDLLTIAADHTADKSTSMNVYDSLGNKYSVTVDFTKCSTGTVYDSTGTAVNVTTVYWEASDSSDNITTTGSGYLAYDTSGNILSGDYYTDAAMTTAVSPAFSSNQSITIAPAASATAPNIATFSIDVSMVGVTDHGSSSSTVTSSSDGYAAGDLSGFSISSDGIITGTYSNGQTQPLGQIALAVFTNPAGLDKVGSNFYAETVNSGAYTAGLIAGTGGSGELSSGTLEMSNVDLSAQFSEMMIAQRAYQASSKLITVYDEMMQTVINAAG